MAYDGYGPYDYRAEQWDAANASPLRARRIGNDIHDDHDVPDREDA